MKQEQEAELLAALRAGKESRREYERNENYSIREMAPVLDNLIEVAQRFWKANS